MGWVQRLQAAFPVLWFGAKPEEPVTVYNLLPRPVIMSRRRTVTDGLAMLQILLVVGHIRPGGCSEHCGGARTHGAIQRTRSIRSGVLLRLGHGSLLCP